MNSSISKLSIPFHRSAVGNEEAQAVADVVRSGWLTMGPKTIEFERQFACYIGVKHAIAVSSCTAALHLSLDAIRIQPGDEVLVPTTTFASTAEVVTYFGARPVLVDVEACSLNIDPADVEKKITPRSKAIIPVHFAGQPCNMNALGEIASQHKLHMVEDAAHALPALYSGKRVGTISELTTFSFYATKTLTTGEGGMVTTNDDSYAQRVQLMRLHGISRDAWKRYSVEGSWFYEVLEAGYKYNFTDLQAALGLVQLSKCDSMSEQRTRVAEQYNRAFSDMPAVQTPCVLPDCQVAWHLYVLRLNLSQLSIDRDGFIRELMERGIGTSVHFIPLHMHPLYRRDYGYKENDCPVACREYSRSLSLPIYPDLSEDEVGYVINSVREVIKVWKR